MSRIKFSLVVATLNRDKELEKLLYSLTQQSCSYFEVIIVDQNNDNRAINVMNNYFNTLKIIHIKCESKGASHARNRGIEKATGEIITFPDDDCEYPVDLLSKVFDELKDNNLSGVSVSSHDKNGEGKIARLSKDRKVIHKYNLYKTCIEAGIFIRKESLGITRFDEELGVGSPTLLWSDEGPDLLLKLINQGKKFLFIPNLYIYHPDPVKLYDEKSIIRSYRYGCGRGAYLKKNKYPLWFVFYVWGLYVVGILIALFQFNPGKLQYFFHGLKGRVKGYVFRESFFKKKSS